MKKIFVGRGDDNVTEEGEDDIDSVFVALQVVFTPYSYILEAHLLV